MVLKTLGPVAGGITGIWFTDTPEYITLKAYKGWFIGIETNYGNKMLRESEIFDEESTILRPYKLVKMVTYVNKHLLNHYIKGLELTFQNGTVSIGSRQGKREEALFNEELIFLRIQEVGYCENITIGTVKERKIETNITEDKSYMPDYAG